MQEQTQQKKQRILQGKVVGVNMDKTAVVKVERHVKHDLYKKIVKRSQKYVVHDEENACHVGDAVEIAETSPISKRKSWTLRQITEKAK